MGSLGIYHIKRLWKKIQLDRQGKPTDTRADTNNQCRAVIPEVIDKAQREANLEVIWRFLDKKENDPDSWYKNHPQWQGIMVQLFQHPVLEANRRSAKSKTAFQALWQSEELTVSSDRVGFNPPERGNWTFPGPYLHWDLHDFNTPVPFGLQGILYLTDTEKNQGLTSDTWDRSESD